MFLFLYGTEKLPVIPEDETVPYRCISKVSDDMYFAFYSNTRIVWISEAELGLGRNNYPYGKYAYITFKAGDGAWSSFEVKSSMAGVILAYRELTWSNHDIKDENGTLYLAASDPVPVTPVQINPALLVQGFLTGQALRRNRT